MTNREVRNALVAFADKVICKKDGTFEARRMYFYRHGMTAEKFTADVMAAMAGKFTGTMEIIDEKDRWAPWPRDSFFSVSFRFIPVAQPTQAISSC